MRSLYQFIVGTSNESLQVLELLNSNITSLGCEFIARCLSPDVGSQIKFLNLDYNNFGNEGLAELVQGLKNNTTITQLSLAYCGIDSGGIYYFNDYLSNENCSLENLSLQGNTLKNSGVTELIGILYSNNSVEELNLNNVLFGGDDKTNEELMRLMQEKQNIKAYSLKFNIISDKGKCINQISNLLFLYLKNALIFTLSK